LYSQSKGEVKSIFQRTADLMSQKLRETADNFVWVEYRDADELIDARIASFLRFIEDFEDGKAGGRYIPCSCIPNNSTLIST
jgi:hypothetical protein